MNVFDIDRSVDEIINRVGPRLVIATPLGLGKPVQLLNALYKKALADSSIHITILTALTFLKPQVKDRLVKKFLDPFFDRVYGDYEDLLYEIDRRKETLPANVRVVEFFLSAGAYLHNGSVQRDFISSNFSHVIRNSEPFGINVVASMIATNNERTRYSLSCNIDIIRDLLRAHKDVLFVGEINNQLPYMYGHEAEIDSNDIDIVLDNSDCHKKLFSIPKEMLTATDFAIGIYASSLIKDDGCLQIGIGSLNDALVYGLILRHKHNSQYQKMLQDLDVKSLHNGIFHNGLCASTELLVDGYLELYKNGILKKPIIDSHGSFIAHAGFFVGSNAFYEGLRSLTVEERQQFSMRSISETNQLYGNEMLRREQRKNASFVNTAMKTTLMGNIISDELADGLTVSGVGGQYNFVAMAQELLGGRSIIMCKSTRFEKGKLFSNIVFSYESCTIPRHLRDIVVSEYGIADLRGQTDENVVKAMLNIADSRFQNKLLQQAKDAKKVSKNYEIPFERRNNFPHAIEKFINRYKNLGYFNSFPFDCEFDESEKIILNVFNQLKRKTIYTAALTCIKGLFVKPNIFINEILSRLQLTKPKRIKDYLDRALIKGVVDEHLKGSENDP